MEQNIFETRQRAQELLAQAVGMWRKSNVAEYLEGLETDPVFIMLMNALAYQANETDSEIEDLKSEILEEIEQTFSTAEAGKALPATAVIKAQPVAGLYKLDVNSNMSFTLTEKDDDSYTFQPLLATRLYSTQVKSVERLDGRRWRLQLHFPDFITSLDQFAFSINSKDFGSLRVSTDGGVEVPLIAPWDYANLPMAHNFSIDTLLYNRTHGVRGGGRRGSLTPYNCYCAMDLFARQEVRMFVVDRMKEIPQTMVLNLIFEFDGISEKFTFKDSDIDVNVIMLANAQTRTSTLTTEMPMERIAGDNVQFLHLLRPEKEQIWGGTPLQVRRVNADRFNRGRLVRLLNSLVCRYASDYYAFATIGSHAVDAVVMSIREQLNELTNMLHGSKSGGENNDGVYLMMDRPVGTSQMTESKNDGVSLNVGYLVTSGSAVNHLLNKDSVFVVPESIDAESVSQIVAPQMGLDEVRNEQAERSLTRYFMSTEDRLVTMADLKLFCYNELITRYGIVRDMVKSIYITREPFDQGRLHTYRIIVDIRLADNIYIRRAFEDKIASVETYLEKMMEVRTTGFYPLKVNISIETKPQG